MNRRRADHNICGTTSIDRSRTVAALRHGCVRSEGGYTLVALLAVMSVLALFAIAAAPSIRQQAQREREKEAIFRGEQVADAIRDYYIYRRGVLGVAGDQALPSSVDDLLEGIPVPGGSKKRQILRMSAARDPLSDSGEWGVVRPRTQKLIQFQEAVMLYSGNVLPLPRSRQIVELQSLAAPQLVGVMAGTLSGSTSGDDEVDAESSGPFVGVASRSRNGSVLYYYGIDQHNQWIFTPLFRW